MSDLALPPSLLPQDLEAVHKALERCLDPEADTLEVFRGIASSLRPGRSQDNSRLSLRHELVLHRLESDPVLLAAFRRHFFGFLASRRLVTFFTDSGILPGTGFFSEWWRIVWQHLLPEIAYPRRLKDCLHLIYERPGDWRWLERVPDEIADRFWRILVPDEELSGAEWSHVRAEMVSALLLLSHRVSGLGVEGELMRASPDFEDYAPRFIALSTETVDFAKALLARIEDPAQPLETGEQLLVIVDQCQEALEHIRKRAQSVGTSIHLVYVLTRSEQSLQRLTHLVAMLADDARTAEEEAIPGPWGAFAREAFMAEIRRDSLSCYLNELLKLLALRVTANAARSGEHYITSNRDEYRALLRSAMGAGIFISIMALAKIAVAGLHLPLFGQAVIFSLDYGVGFVIIYMLGFTIATKQPAMTAQTLAAYLSDLNLNKAAELDRIADLVAGVARSQLAAIAGNICVAFPVALALGVSLSGLMGAPPISPEKAGKLLGDLNLLGWAIPHAAIAGFYLYLAGLISGFFDNQSAYHQLEERIVRLPWLNQLVGPERARSVGCYVGTHLGGLMGNFLFGCMLGSTGVLGTILGLPLDIRHIAFSSANLAYALVGFRFDLPWETILWSVLGVLVIGLTNLTVSFGLALRTALGARRMGIHQTGRLLSAIGQRLRSDPRSFFLPPKE